MRNAMDESTADDFSSPDPIESISADPSDDTESASVFLKELERYLATLEAISELAEILAPSVAKLDQRMDRPFRQLVRAQMPHADEEESEELVRLSLAAIEAVMNDVRDSLAKLKDDSDGSITIGGRGSALNSAIDVVVAQSKGAIASDTLMGTVFQALAQSRRVSVGRQDLLMRSLLTTAVSAFEMLFAGIAGGYFRLYPGAMDSATPEFSLRQLIEMSDLSEAVDRSVDGRVEDILRQGLDGQVAWLKSKDGLSIDVKSSIDDWNAVREVFERRNCVVHHGGHVSSQYLAKVRNPGVGKGELLSVDSEYLSHAVDDLATVGVFVALSAWRRLRSSEVSELVDFVGEDGYELLRYGRWAPAQAMFQFAIPLAKEERLRHVFAVNVWLCKKNRMGLDSIFGEVEKWDTSALEPQLKLARLALLDRNEEALDLAKRLVEQGELAVRLLVDWPLLSGIRTLPAYGSVLSSLRDNLAEMRAKKTRSKPESGPH